MLEEPYVKGFRSLFSLHSITTTNTPILRMEPNLHSFLLILQDIIEEMCSLIGVRNPHEQEEYSLYCIVEGDTFTMPLAREEYILDVTTELLKNQQVSIGREEG